MARLNITVSNVSGRVTDDEYRTIARVDVKDWSVEIDLAKFPAEMIKLIMPPVNADAEIKPQPYKMPA